uniref:Uncharacterized protein n=1 Tax=Cacopsylla melanoneura TaxID=428564 RepID=A0A8D9A740_9HEMI
MSVDFFHDSILVTRHGVGFRSKGQVLLVRYIVLLLALFDTLGRFPLASVTGGSGSVHMVLAGGNLIGAATLVCPVSTSSHNSFLNPVSPRHVRETTIAPKPTHHTTARNKVIRRQADILLTP